MNNLKTQKNLIQSSGKHAFALVITNIVLFAGFFILTVLLLAALLSKAVATIIVMFVLFYFFAFLIKLLLIIFTITTLFKISNISNKFSKGISSTGGTMVIVGIFIPLISFIGAIIAYNETKKSLILLEELEEKELKN